MLRKLAKQSAIYALADGLVKSSDLILTPYYIYKLSIEEFGQFGIIVAVLSLGKMVFNLGFQSGIIRYYHFKESRRSSIISSSFLALFVISLFVAPILGLTIHWLGVFEPNLVEFEDVLLLMLAAALYGVFVKTGIALMKVQERPVASGVLGVCSSVPSLIFIIYFIEAALFPPLQSIIVGQLLGIAVGGVTTLILSRKYLTTKMALDDFKEVFSYSFPLVPHNGLQWALSNVDRFVIVKILGSAQLGGYFFCVQFAMGIRVLLRAVNSSLLSVFSQLSVGKIDVENVRSVNRAYAGLVVVLCVGVGLAAPVAVSFLKLAEYGPYLYLIPLLIAGGSLYGLYYVPMNILSISLGESRYLYLITLVAAVVNFGLNLAFVRYGAHVAAIVNVVSYATLLLGFMKYARRHDLYRRVVGGKYLQYAVAVIVLISFGLSFIHLSLGSYSGT